MSGGRHIQFLLANGLVSPKPSAILDEMYRRLALPAPPKPEVELPAEGDADATSDPQVSGSVEEERVLLESTSGKQLAQALEFPDLETEIDRAIWQVETGLKKAKGEQQKQKDSAEADQSSAASDASSDVSSVSKDETKKTK